MDIHVIRGYFDLGLFSDNDLDLFVQCGWIDENQKIDILGNI